MVVPVPTAKASHAADGDALPTALLLYGVDD